NNDLEVLSHPHPTDINCAITVRCGSSHLLASGLHHFPRPIQEGFLWGGIQLVLQRQRTLPKGKARFRRFIPNEPFLYLPNFLRHAVEPLPFLRGSTAGIPQFVGGLYAGITFHTEDSIRAERL